MTNGNNMEPMVTIPVTDYNKLIDKALNGVTFDIKKAINKIREAYCEEKRAGDFERRYFPGLNVERICELLLEKIDESNGDIPQAIKEWTKNISSEKSES